MRTILTTSLLTLALGASASADVLTVNVGPGSDHSSIAAAVAAAVDGDILLVGAGSQGGFSIDDKQLTVVAAEGAGSVLVAGPIVVTGLAANRTVELIGLRATGLSGTSDPLQGHGFVAYDNQGQVLLQKCTFTGGAGDPGGWDVDDYQLHVTGHAAGWHAALVEDNPGPVSFNNCLFFGGHGVNMIAFEINDCGCTYGEPGGAALAVSNALVTVHSSLLEGGDGSHADRVGGRGGAGLEALSGDVYLSGSNASGGTGGFGNDYFGPVYGGDGGHALAVASGTIARRLDNTLTGGVPGNSLDGLPGAPGQQVGGDGSAVALAGSARGLGVSNPVFDDGSALLQVAGDPGDTILLLLSFGTNYALVPKFKGPLLVDLPATSLVLGSVPAGGVLNLPAAMPDIAIEGVVAYLQAIVGTAGDAAFTGEATLVLLDNG